jgi:ribosomal protein S27AE
MRLVDRNSNEEKSNSCRSTEKWVVALGGYQWNESVSYIVLFHWQPLEAIFISSESQLRKKGWTQRASGPAKSDPRLLPYSRGSGISPPGRFIFSKHNIKKWPLVEIEEEGRWKWTKTICENPAMASFLTDFKARWEAGRVGASRRSRKQRRIEEET